MTDHTIGTRTAQGWLDWFKGSQREEGGREFAELVEAAFEKDESWSEETEAKQVMQALRVLKENPWDTINLHYDAGEWSVTLHEDAAQTLEIEPGECLLDRLNAAIQQTRALPKEAPRG